MDGFFDIDAELLALVSEQSAEQDNLQELVGTGGENITPFQAESFVIASDTAIGSFDDVYMDMLLEQASGDIDIIQPVTGKQIFTENDDEEDEDLDEVFVHGSIDTSDDDDDDDGDVLGDDEDDYDYDDDEEDEDENDEGGDVNLNPEVMEQLANAIGLLADSIDAASKIAPPGDKAKLEALSDSLKAIQLSLAAGGVISADTVINALGDAYSIALNEASNWAVTAITTGVALMVTGPHGAAITGVMTAFTTFMADAVGLTQDFYDRAGDLLAQLTYDAIMALAGLADSIAALRDAVEEGIVEFVNDPTGTVSGIIGIPLLPSINPFGPNNGDEGFERY